MSITNTIVFSQAAGQPNQQEMDIFLQVTIPSFPVWVGVVPLYDNSSYLQLHTYLRCLLLVMVVSNLCEASTLCPYS